MKYRDRVKAGQPLFKLDSTEQEAAIETAGRKITEVEASMQVAKSQLAESEGKIAQARGALQQALDEFNTRSDLRRRNPRRHPATRGRPRAGSSRYTAGPCG